MAAIALLPMYDFPEVRTATDALWSAVARELHGAGIHDAPLTLARGYGERESWRHPDLLLGQSCGYPAMREFRDEFRIVAAPIYDAPGCEGSRHCSFLVVPTDSSARQLADLRGARFALNSFDSNTGMNLPRLAFAPFASQGRFLGEIIETGGHAASLALVAEHRADLAAIDCVTHALLARHRPHLVAATRILAHSAPSPALPFITARSAGDGMILTLRQALAAALRDPALLASRKALFLEGVVPAAEADYAILSDYEETARELGYPRLG